MINEPGRVFVARGRLELTMPILAPGELADLMERILRTSGRPIDLWTPIVDVTLTGTGIPAGTNLWAVSSATAATAALPFPT